MSRRRTYVRAGYAVHSGRPADWRSHPAIALNVQAGVNGSLQVFRRRSEERRQMFEAPGAKCRTPAKQPLDPPSLQEREAFWFGDPAAP